MIKAHISHTEANTQCGRFGILQHELDPSPSKSGTSAFESNLSPLDPMESQPDRRNASPIESNTTLIESETAAHLVNHLNITHITSLEWLLHQYVLTDDMLKPL